MARALLILVAAVLLVSCGPRRSDPGLMDRVAAGEFGDARQYHESLSDVRDRDSLLARARWLQLALAEGIPEAAARDAEIIYDTLRTQGINQDRDLGTLIRGEQFARNWKGEPFEQAMMLHAVALLDASRGEWDNAQAACSQALVLLEDFSTESENGLRLPAFEQAYIVRAIAARASQQPEQLEEACALLGRVAPRLAGLADDLRHKPFNTVLVVDAGLGPAKVAGGSHASVESWAARFGSDEMPLVIEWGGRREQVPIASDVNRLADELSWAHLDELRAGKAALGDVLIAGGAIMVGDAEGDEDEDQELIGWAAIAAGVILTSTAHADTRHLDVLPQRSYYALLDLPDGAHDVRLSVPGHTAMALTGVRPGTARRPALIYSRLPSTDADWAHGGRVYYSNDATGAAPSGDPRAHLPFLLGGHDVRTPTAEALRDYQDAGFLQGYSLNDLRELYRAERIVIAEPGGKGTPPTRHILEGGRALYTPRPGSAGFARLFGRKHPKYQPRSERVRAAHAQVQQQLNQ